MNKTLVAVVVLAVLASVGSFYGGMWYAGASAADQSDVRPRVGSLTATNVNPEQRQVRGSGMGEGARMGGIGFISGEIISKDAASITLKLLDNGSKIVFFASSTTITKSASGSPDDLSLGEQVTVNGDANQDGSMSAQTIQIRPTSMAPAPRQ